MAMLTEAPASARMVKVERSLDELDLAGTRFERLGGVRDRLEKAHLTGVTAVLHGSVADASFTGFSDVDDLVVLHRESWQEPASLKAAADLLSWAACCYQHIDPFQHHGHWVITDFDLLLYDESQMPLVAVNDAVALIGRKHLQFRVTDDRTGFVRNAMDTVLSMQNRLVAAAARHSITAFNLKALAGEVAILPAYIFQARGLLLDKPQAIQRAHELYSSDALPALAWAASVRNRFCEFLHSWRTQLLSCVTGSLLPRRDQAQVVLQRLSSRVSDSHPLGLHPDVLCALAVFAEESRSLAAGCGAPCG